MRIQKWAGALGVLLVSSLMAGVGYAQVFTVGERSATADLKTDLSPTHVELPNTGLTERGRLDLVRNLVGEQGYAHRALPLGASLTLQANGGLKPGPDEYKKLIYQKGTAAVVGDRVAITAFAIKGDSLEIDFNGGPYLRHRFLRHVSIMGAQPAMNDGQVATGTRVMLTFEGGIPEVSAAEVKALLQPVVDFGVKSGEIAYADTLPAPVKDANAAHEVKVGMSHRMVLAALGSPESKVREEENGKRYEEWIYGHVPQTVQFIRFVGDRVEQVKTAKVGQPIQIDTREELADYLPGGPVVRQVSMGDTAPAAGKSASSPTLLKPGETAAVGESQGRVILPPDSSSKNKSTEKATVPASSAPASPQP